MPERFGVSIPDCSPRFRVTCCGLQGTVATALDSVITFPLNVMESGGDGVVHVPLANVIVAEELLYTMPCRLKVLPTGIEINLVNPGFNSGWVKIQGIWRTGGRSSTPGPVAAINPSNLLVDFGGNGKYRAPEFSWLAPVAPTALTFLNSSKLGKQYENDMFVADVLYGNIYDFKLNQSRTGFLLNSTLDDKIANTQAED